MNDPFEMFDSKVNGVIWGKQNGDFRVEAPDSLPRHEEAARKLGITGGRLIFPSVEHGSTIGIFGQIPISSIDHLRWRTDEPCDGLLLSSNGKIGMAFTPADCPILVFLGERRNESYLALIHCGWREVLAGIIYKAVKLFYELGILPKDIRVLATPGIGACCFEVGPEVMAGYLKLFSPTYFRSRSLAGKPSINLMRVIMEELTNSNVGEFRAMTNICTSCDRENYWSHRRGDQERNFIGVALA